MKYERMRQRLLPTRRFGLRVAAHAVLALALVAISLGIGAVGYHGVAGLPWIDALLNAAMILTGMGPVDPMRTSGAKVFATCYAIFSGVAFLSIVGILLAPIVHRFLHKFHLESASED